MSDTVRKQRRTKQPEAPLPEPEFSEVVIFYNWVFDLGGMVNPTEAARMLLATDFALCAPNYASDETEIATRFRELSRLRATAQDLVEVDQVLGTRGVRGLAGWAFRHPRKAWRLWRQRQDSANQAQGEAENEEADTAEEEASENADLKSTMGEVVSSLDKAMTKIGVLEGLQRFTDRGLFSPFYLRETPFVRVGLQPFFAEVAGEDLSVDVGVLIHRSGIAVLSFYVAFEGNKSVDDIIRLQVASKLKLETSEVVRAVVEPQARAEGLSQSAIDAAPFDRRWSSGVEWFRYQHSGEVTLADLFELYRGAVICGVREREPMKQDEPYSWLRSSDWFAYPVVFIRHVSPAISNSAMFRERYPGQLASLVMRFPTWRRLNRNKIQTMIANDVALTEDHAVYVEAGNTTVLYYEPCRQDLMARFGEDIPGQEWLAKHFQTSAVTDMLLVQWGVLNALEQLVHKLPRDLTKLYAIKRDFALLVQEYYDPLFSYGTAQEIVRAAKDTMGITAMYQRVTQKLEGLDRLIQAEESNLRARRDTLLKVAAFIGTLLFGLVGAWQTIDVVSRWNDVIMKGYSGWGTSVLASIASFVQAHSIHLALLLYLIAACTVTSISLWSLVSRKSKRPIVQSDQSESAYTPGFTWPVGIQWVPGDKDPDHDQ